jgi:hypothetical protein
MKIVDEDPARNEVPLGHHLGERINVIIVLQRDVMQLASSEFVL